MTTEELIAHIDEALADCGAATYVQTAGAVTRPAPLPAVSNDDEEEDE